MAVTWKKLAFEDDVILKTLVTTTGDIIYASAANTPARLGVGSNTNVLTLAAGIPSWAALGVPGAHASSHQDAGADEISVTGLSGLLADDQHVLDAEVQTVVNATSITSLADASGAVGFAGQQATDLVIHTVADAAGRPTAVVGKAVFQSDTLAAYLCTVAV